MTLDGTSELGAEHSSENNFRELLDVRVDRTGEGFAVVSISEPSKQLLQEQGNIHGGVYATLIDCAVGEAVKTVLNDSAIRRSTSELSVSYLRPVSGGRITGEGRILKAGQRTLVGTAEIKDLDDRLVAVGRCTYVLHK